MNTRIPCIYHPSELITNFCQDQTCLMPLCPVCISEHTSYHEDQNTRPHYCSINQIVSETYAQINNSIESLQRDHVRNGQLIVEIKLVEDKIRDKINSTKQVVYRAIEQAFGELEKSLMQKLEKWHQSNNIYCLELSEKKDKLLMAEIQQLKYLKEGLNTHRALSNIIFFYREKMTDVQNLHSQISTYLHTNQNYHPTLELNNEAIYSIEAIINRIIKVPSSTPTQPPYNKNENLRVSQIISHTANSNIKSRSDIKSRYNLQYTPIQKIDTAVMKHQITPNKSISKNSSNSQFTKINTLKPLQESQLAAQDQELQKSRKNERGNLQKNKSSSKLKSNRVDENYENITKKVAAIRNQNQRISRNLKFGHRMYEYAEG